MNANQDPESSRERGKDTERRVLLVGNRLESRELFIATREITIGHAGGVYRLRLTAQNKLILTK
jgi:hemin uptake protein HemP